MHPLLLMSHPPFCGLCSYYFFIMSSSLRNGDATHPRLPSPAAGPSAVLHHHNHNHNHHFYSTVLEQKNRRLKLLVLLLRLAAFCFSLAAAVFTSTNFSRFSGSPSWLHFDSFRLVFAANAIVAFYSLFEMCASGWEILKGATLLPEPVQLWFEFGHDQVFSYMALAAGVAGAVESRWLKAAGTTCTAESAFCVQADISVALGFAGFAFLALSTLVSGFRIGCYVFTGSRFRTY